MSEADQTPSTPATETTAGFLTVRTTSMEPEMMMGDVVGYASVDRFTADDLYVLDFGHGPFVMRCQSSFAKEAGLHIRCFFDKGGFEPHAFSGEEFSCYVVGRVFAIVHVHDRFLMERAGISFAKPERAAAPSAKTAIAGTAGA